MPDIRIIAGLTFALLRRANMLRLPTFRNRKGELSHTKPDGSDWSPAQWMNAVTGEVGEAAGLIKQVDRGDISMEEAKPLIAEELADIVTYVDLLAYRLGISLGEATIVKFNKISERVGSDVRFMKS